MRVAQNLYVAAKAADAANQEPGAAQGPLESCGGELVSLFAAAKKRAGCVLFVPFTCLGR